MATKKMTPKKTTKSKVLHKAKKLEATKPLVVKPSFAKLSND